jgi:pectate lyase
MFLVLPATASCGSNDTNGQVGGAAGSGATLGAGTTGSGGLVGLGGSRNTAGSAGTSLGGSTAIGGSPTTGGATITGGAPASGGSGSTVCPTTSSSPDVVIGWAAYPGDGVSTTQGGEGGTTLEIGDADRLRTQALSADPLILRITQSMDIGTLDVASNKTLIGVGTDVVLSGSVRIRPTQSTAPLVSNVIVRNLKINGATAIPDDGGDAVHIERAHHVWIDHCEIYDSYDGNADVTHGANWVTFSWNKFYYTSNAANPSHQFSNLIGHSDDNASVDSGRLKVTFHHNWWGENVEQRMPRTRYGQIHVFNNYYRPVVIVANSATIAAGLDSSVLIENNYFDGVQDPHFHHEGSNATILAVGNFYTPTTTGSQETDTAAFNPPYDYSLDPAECIPALVTAGAGPH